MKAFNSRQKKLIVEALLSICCVNITAEHTPKDHKEMLQIALDLNKDLDNEALNVFLMSTPFDCENTKEAIKRFKNLQTAIIE